MSEGFYFKPLAEDDTILVFFRWCRMFKVEDEKRRIECLRKLVARKKVNYIPHPEEFLADKNVRKL